MFYRRATLFSKLIYILFIFAFTIINSAAQEYKFSHITEDNGLSQGVVNCIMQDSRGFMWFGTQDGLNKYDGYNIKIFKHDPKDTNSISNNYIYCIFEDNNNNLWIGTSGGGLSEYNLSTGKFKTHAHSDSDAYSISDDNVRTIFQDSDGQIWAGTENGLVSYDTKTGRFTTFKTDSTNQNSITSSTVFHTLKFKAMQDVHLCMYVCMHVCMYVYTFHKVTFD